MKLIVLKNQLPINEFIVDLVSLDEIYEIYVGRSEDCHILIDDPLISRHHFVIKNENVNWYCEKLTNLGVITINGSIVTKNKLNSGDEIKFGVYSILINELASQKVESAPVSNLEISQASSPIIQEDLGQLENLEEVTELLESKEDVLEDSSLESQEIAETNLGDDSLQLSEEAPQEESLSEGFNVEEQSFSTSDEGNTFQDTSSESSSLAEIPDSSLSDEYQDDNNEGTRVFNTFLNFQLALFGENAPYDRFQIEQDEIFIGRDSKKCQIILDDPEVSSVHAVIRKKGNDITLEDLNSSNGTILNGERINKAHVSTGDDFIIGSTTFTLEVKSDLLDIESDRLMPVESGQTVETEEVIEEEVTVTDHETPNFEADAPQEKSIIKRILKNPQQRKKVIYAVAVIALIMLLGEDENADLSDQDKNKTKDPQAKVKEGETDKGKDNKNKIKLSPEQENKMKISYELGVSFFEQGKYFEAHKEFKDVMDISPEYKKVQSYFDQTNEALKRIEELEKEKRAEAERIEKKKKVDDLLVKARDAVKEKKVQVAESFFSQIIELDPENIEIGQLKLELEAWQKEEERKALEEAAKVAARKKMVDQLNPGKTGYLKKEWYRAILKLEEFMQIKGMDEDLLKEGSEMLSDAKNQLASEIGPVLGKARSLKEGQDLKNAYEAYLDVLKIEPTNSEALNELDDIKNQLEARSRKIYREAIISESLSLFADAKEKFQEVQQISPTDSEYYKKATEKLKDYLE
jgi:pSer/pThr/pTyr-binding forkhead associated (FHA) protein